jgi:hypothetical protein
MAWERHHGDMATTKMAGNAKCKHFYVAALSLLGETAVTSDFGEERRCKKLDFYFLPTNLLSLPPYS